MKNKRIWRKEGCQAGQLGTSVILDLQHRAIRPWYLLISPHTRQLRRYVLGDSLYPLSLIDTFFFCSPFGERTSEGTFRWPAYYKVPRKELWAILSKKYGAIAWLFSLKIYIPGAMERLGAFLDCCSDWKQWKRWTAAMLSASSHQYAFLTSMISLMLVRSIIRSLLENRVNFSLLSGCSDTACDFNCCWEYLTERYAKMLEFRIKS